MALRKRRSDIAKMVTAARDVWRQSVVYAEVKRACKVRPNWFKCQRCNGEVQVIRIDHYNPIGSQPDFWTEFGPWLRLLFCDKSNLQGLCLDCYALKNKEDRHKLKVSHGDHLSSPSPV
jgi:hypothetical protein